MDKRFSDVETIKPLQIKLFSDGTDYIDNLEYSEKSFKVLFEVKFKKDTNPSIPSGQYNWVFSLVKRGEKPWRIYDFGY